MKRDSGNSRSVWTEPRGLSAHPPLVESLRTDVVVVGAGIAGLSTAYMLARRGLDVVVLDDGVPGGGETGRTTAHLSSALDDGFDAMESMHGLKNTRLAAESHASAIDRIEAIVVREKITCEFERLDGYLFGKPDENPAYLEKERDAAHRAGLGAVELVGRAPLHDFETGAALRFPRQAQFHPLKYLNGLIRALRAYGGRLYGNTHVDSVTGGTPAKVVTAHGHEVLAGAVVVATNTPVNDLVTMHTKQAAYRSYVITSTVPAGTVHPALYWDTADPYHYVRLRPAAETGDGADHLIVGGEDHKTGEANDADKRWEHLEAWARARFPNMGPLTHRWSGQVMEPVDGLAFIGRNPLDAENVFIATGDSGMGMTHGTIAGMLLTDLITGRENEWAKLYDPGRIRARSGYEWLKENVDAAMRYGRWFTPGDVASVDEIPRGHGAVIRQGLSKVAVFRDGGGQLHQFSAVCPHLGCIVAWNDGEKTFDCPAHGSRFDAQGAVVNGPANCGLTPLEEAPGLATPAPGGARRGA